MATAAKIARSGLTPMSSIPILPYDPRKEGLQRWIGPLSATVMDYLWEDGRPLTVRRIKSFIGIRRGYTTFATTLDRLVDKGLLNVYKKRGYKVYEQRYDRQVWEQAQYDALLASIPAGLTMAGGAWGHEGWA